MVHKLYIEGSGIDGVSNEDILLFIISHFSEDLTNALNTSKIVTDNSVVHIGEYTNPEPVLYAKEVFKKKFDVLPKDQKMPFLNGVAAGINYGHTIELYNQDFVFELYSVLSGKTLQESEIEYLEGLPLAAVPQAYKIGIVPHELGHSIYDVKIRDTQLQDERIKITDEFGPVTKYVQAYETGDGIYYEENFTESLRIYTTNVKYLQDKYPAMCDFIKNNFPTIYT